MTKMNKKMTKTSNMTDEMVECDKMRMRNG